MDKNETFLLLEKEYSPYIDSALFFAIVSDYDLSRHASVQELRATLAILKQDAEAQADSVFDPSGTTGRSEDSSTSQTSDRGLSRHGDHLQSDKSESSSSSRSHDSCGRRSADASEMTLSDDMKNSDYGDETETLSIEEKTAMLAEMFPSLKIFDVQYVLKKFDFHFGRAVEELLNHVFFGEEETQNGNQIIKKGIDAFIDLETSRGRKSRGKNRRQNRGASSESSLPVDKSITRDRWDRAKEDIDFITQRTFLPRQTVSSAYHKSGASLASTIAALCDTSYTNPYLTSSSQAALQAHISELAVKYSSLSVPQVTALVNLSHPSTASAHELAQVLATSLATSSSKIIPHYLVRPPSPPSRASSPTKSLAPLPASTASQLSSARDIAFAQANAAYRKSRSDPLMAGAASYYSAIGRETAASLRRHEAASAEILVSSQSKPGEIDFHGVRVQDAVRMAKERVELWWESQGREWAREGKVMDGGLKIVTGVGRHSEGGKGRLGPAVGSMLLKEGWKVEFGEGFLLVLGRARR